MSWTPSGSSGASIESGRRNHFFPGQASLLYPEESAELMDLLETANGGVLVNYRSRAIKGIASTGIDLIRNKELMDEINNYCSLWDFGNELYRIEFYEFHNSQWLPFMRKHMNFIPTNIPLKRSYSPKNYQQMVLDPVYPNLLVEKKLSL